MRTLVTLSLGMLLLVGCSDSHGTDDGGGDDAGPALSCEGANDCVLRPASCCGSCGAPTPDDMVALQTSEVDDYVERVCADVGGCPECFMAPDPYLVATCEMATCTAKNLHEEPLTVCDTDADCVLAATPCCTCGEIGSDSAIAFNPDRGSIGSLICDPRADCPPCVPTFVGIEAGCDAGRCVVREL
jgi:hypothetical protein